jgi:hypothetical protein
MRGYKTSLQGCEGIQRREGLQSRGFRVARVRSKRSDENQ